MTTVDEALRPVGNALVSKAQREAGRILAEASDDVAHTEQAARDDAKELLDEARAQGEADARILLAEARAAARRVARSTELRAQRQVFDQLRRRVLASVHELRDAPDYPKLRAAITTHVLEVLGPGTVVHEHPSGGVVARAPGRYLDYSLAALAQQALDRVAPELEELWTP